MISFGSRSILLLVGIVHGMVLAALLLRTSVNRFANRVLALLLIFVALRVVPYIIGFAGFYDAYPWLTYFPYEFSLGYGAVIWLYVRVICTGTLPPHWRWHLAPAALQGLYYGALFLHPTPWKFHWDAAVHLPIVVPIESAWTLASLTTYLALAWREYARYQRWLDSDLSNREEFRLRWLRGFLVAVALTLLFWGGTMAFEAFVRPLTYFDRFPLYLWFSLLVYALGIGGVRNAGRAYPHAAAPHQAGTSSVVEAPANIALAPETPATAVRETDWAAMGEKWRAQVEAEEWWRNPDLTAPLLARLLATNTTYLSRALNEGLGQNFNEFVNRIRVRAVQAELARTDCDRDVLAIALDAGFNAKASFNRVFKRLTGETPTDYRRRHGPEASQLQ